eukprot:m.6108 g.6108  ORF g.6108 m.6108 type:complete len:606 (+) comp2547_c0_seq1:54-1871(+)
MATVGLMLAVLVLLLRMEVFVASSSTKMVGSTTEPALSGVVVRMSCYTTPSSATSSKDWIPRSLLSIPMGDLHVLRKQLRKAVRAVCLQIKKQDFATNLNVLSDSDIEFKMKRTRNSVQVNRCIHHKLLQDESTYFNLFVSSALSCIVKRTTTMASCPLPKENEPSEVKVTMSKNRKKNANHHRVVPSKGNENDGRGTAIVLWLAADFSLLSGSHEENLRLLMDPLFALGDELSAECGVSECSIRIWQGFSFEIIAEDALLVYVKDDSIASALRSCVNNVSISVLGWFTLEKIFSWEEWSVFQEERMQARVEDLENLLGSWMISGNGESCASACRRQFDTTCSKKAVHHIDNEGELAFVLGRQGIVCEDMFEDIGIAISFAPMIHVDEGKVYCYFRIPEPEVESEFNCNISIAPFERLCCCGNDCVTKSRLEQFKANDPDCEWLASSQQEQKQQQKELFLHHYQYLGASQLFPKSDHISGDRKETMEEGDAGNIVDSGLWMNGNAGESCDEVCSRVHLSCNPASMLKLSSREEMMFVVGELGVPSCEVTYSTAMKEAPYFYRIKGYTYCLYFYGRDGHSPSCSSKSKGLERICCCGEAQCPSSLS